MKKYINKCSHFPEEKGNLRIIGSSGKKKKSFIIWLDLNMSKTKRNNIMFINGLIQKTTNLNSIKTFGR